ncbi:SDR family oxidoreductase [Micromonospora endophytica]|uniref:LysR family transcriptional regulator n=1 Tax=Micromonospora endophytica TaxID=515350 RepID=A0A2W2DBZ1_9ACTN|nr:SDR family oxidoreductase [Micromonospora endophytica]PZF97357.1 LysR family transcriptional regulator [Micromonospora endophytica]RIW42376.1 SDR family oxidoreductase [Micromonospora endophytica]BCJ57025.1 LysR family transcriptional regulator [Micromonospora endophytica]
MKIAVLGGTGLIGSQVVVMLREHGHEAVALSPSNGVDLLTGEGLDAGLKGADVALNLTNSTTFDEKSADFFRTSMENLLAAAQREQVGHVVILSIVGVDQVPDPYYRAKVLQEKILAAGPVPYTIVRATQFFEFIGAIMSWTSDDDTVRLPATPVQPMASADVARAVARVAVGAPCNGIQNVAGPEVLRLDEWGRVALAATGDTRTVVVDPTAGIFGVVPGDVLTAPQDAVLATTSYREWLAR